jgi:hypothetical protein
MAKVIVDPFYGDLPERVGQNELKNCLFVYFHFSVQGSSLEFQVRKAS